MKTKIVFLIVILFCSVSVLSQYKYNSGNSLNDSSEVYKDLILKTDECDIFLKDRSRRSDVSITGITDSILKIEEGTNYDFIKVKDINKIRFHAPSGFWQGALVGAAISLTYFAFTGSGEHSSEGKSWSIMLALISIVPAGLVGGLIGIGADPDDDIYDFTSYNPSAKMKRLKYLMKKHSPLLPQPPP